jgi:hypothetical protein
MSTRHVATLSTELRPPMSIARTRAQLVTLATRDGSPLLVVDPRAGETVARDVAAMHTPDLKLLAWSVVSDRALVLLLPTDGRDLRPDVYRLHDRTTARLSELGHPEPWTAVIQRLPIRPHHDLRSAIEYVLAAPVRQGLSDAWPGWRWSGSGQWPGMDPHFLARHSSDYLWLDAATADEPGDRVLAPDAKEPPEWPGVGVSAERTTA